MSVSWGTQYSKLKTNLRLAANRLKLLQKKKTEQAVKARYEISEFLNTDKEDRARIRVESIIREDFVVEAYELLEMYCELLLARFGIIQQMKDLDDGIAEAVSSLLWVAPRIGHEVSEFKVISDELTHKYGKQFAEAARMNQLPEPSRVSPKLVNKLSVNAPSKLLVEKYLITIAQSSGINFTPDPKVMRDDDDEIARAERNLINFMNEEQYGWNVKSNNDGHGGSKDTGVKPTDQMPNIGMDVSNSNKPTAGQFFPAPVPNASASPPPEYAPPVPSQYIEGLSRPMSTKAVELYPNHYQLVTNQNLPTTPPEHIYEVPPNQQAPSVIEQDNDFLLPKFPEPPRYLPKTTTNNGASGDFPVGGSPSVPSNEVTESTPQDLDFEALARRFEELKKKI